MISRRMMSAVALALTMILMSGCTEQVVADRIVEQDMEQTITLDTVTLTIEDVEYMRQVQPPNPSGYYDYYPEVEGWRYCVLSGSIENAGSESVSLNNCSVCAQAGKKEREAKLVVMNSSEIEFMDEIPANLSESWEFYLIAAVKNGEEPDQIAVCFDEGLKKHQEDEKWDNQIIIYLDDLK